jgi:hypothetical protein
LTKQLALDDWGTDWLVLHFDEPLEYDNASHAYVLIRVAGSVCRSVRSSVPYSSFLTEKVQWQRQIGGRVRTFSSRAGVK